MLDKPTTPHPIRQLREEARITQNALAYACKVAGGHVVSNWENWRTVPYYRNAETVAAVLGRRLGREIDPQTLRPDLLRPAAPQEGVRDGLQPR